MRMIVFIVWLPFKVMVLIIEQGTAQSKRKMRKENDEPPLSQVATLLALGFVLPVS